MKYSPDNTIPGVTIGQPKAYGRAIDITEKQMRSQDLNEEIDRLQRFQRAGRNEGLRELRANERDYDFPTLLQEMAKQNGSVEGGNGLAAEISRKLCKTFGYTASDLGIAVPWSTMSHRDLSVGTNNVGGFTVQSTVGGLVPFLRNRSVCIDLGATVYENLVGNLELPTQTATTAPVFLSEAQACSDATATTFGNISLLRSGW